MHNNIVNKISEISKTAVELAYLEVKEEEYDIGPGLPTTKWKKFPGFFRDSSGPISGFSKEFDKLFWCLLQRNV